MHLTIVFSLCEKLWEILKTQIRLLCAVIFSMQSLASNFVAKHWILHIAILYIATYTSFCLSRTETFFWLASRLCCRGKDLKFYDWLIQRLKFDLLAWQLLNAPKFTSTHNMDPEKLSTKYSLICCEVGKYLPYDIQ